jgi:hypothetical protein
MLLIHSGRMGDGGGLQTLQEQAGPLGVERVVGDAEDDLCQGYLDGAAIRDNGKSEGLLSGGAVPAAGVRTRGVVVETKRLAAEGIGAAAVAGGVSVGASELLIGDGRRFLHGGLPGGWLNGKSPAFAPG